jgi:hypothetical protein
MNVHVQVECVTCHPNASTLTSVKRERTIAKTIRFARTHWVVLTAYVKKAIIGRELRFSAKTSTNVQMRRQVIYAMRTPNVSTRMALFFVSANMVGIKPISSIVLVTKLMLFYFN